MLIITFNHIYILFFIEKISNAYLLYNTGDFCCGEEVIKLVVDVVVGIVFIGVVGTDTDESSFEFSFK